MKIVVAHPGRQHSYELYNALYSAGFDVFYCTTIYNKRNWLNSMLGSFLGYRSKQRFAGRRIAGVPDSRIIQIEMFFGLIVSFLLLVDRRRKYYTILNNALNRSFGKKVARWVLANDVEMVIGYDSCSQQMFEYLRMRDPKIIRILDNAHPSRWFLYNHYNKNSDLYGTLEETLSSCGYILDRNKAVQYEREIKLANYHIVASQFSFDSLTYSDVSPDYIHVIPYGISSVISYEELELKKKQPLKVLFVGEINQRKGIYQFIHIAKTFAEIQDIEFHAVGIGKERYDSLYAGTEMFVKWHGWVTKEVLIDLYQSSHLFLFPVMGEGFGKVILEAMSFGLPVISSSYCAGPDIITHGEDGFILDFKDLSKAQDLIVSLNSNRDGLNRISRNALKTSTLFTKEEYSKSIVRVIGNLT